MTCKDESIRTAMVLGIDAVEKLKNAHVAVFGICGVGGAACEALARAGVGSIDLFDHDSVSLSNINRQIIALHSTVGKPKVEVMKERILDINPDCRVNTFRAFYLPENADDYPLDSYDYIADAIDTVSAKLELAVRAKAVGVPLISSMGTGNKLDPTRFEVTDISKTFGCPLARVMRRELKARGIHRLKVVFSPEEAVPAPATLPENAPTKGNKPIPGSLSFVPPVAGYILAGEIIKDLTVPFKIEKGGKQ